MMKKHISIVMLCFLIAPVSRAQFSFGTDGFFIKSGASVTLDGLTIAPDADLTWSNKTLEVSHAAIPGSPHNSIQRVYSFNEAFSFTGTIGIFYQPSELNGNTESSLQIGKSGAVGTHFITSSGSTVDLGRHYVYNTLNTDIRIISAMTSNALPVTLISFTARKENQTALLSWSTSLETNSDFFEIQRSSNGKTWQTIGQVASNGESKSTRHYSFTDGEPSHGENLYRLKMVDKDETFAYSSIRSVRFETLIETTLFPNPVVDRFMIQTEDWSKVRQVQIVNAMGAKVYESVPSQLGNIPAKGINVQGLSAGFYIVKITSLNGGVDAVKLVKY